MALGVAEGGSERADLWVLQTASGKLVDGPISRTDAAQPSWTPDGKGFFYNRLAAGKSEADRYSDSQARWHALGSTLDDPIVFGNANPASKGIDKLHFPYVFVDPAGELVYGFVTRGTERPYALYLSTMKDVRAGKPQWKPVFGFDAGYEVQQPDDFPPLALREGKLPLFTRKGNPDGSVVLLDPRNPEAGPKLLYAAKDRPITYYTLARDGFFVRLQDGPVGRVVRIDTRTGAATPIAMPVEGAATFSQANPDADGLLALVGGWTAPQEWQYVAKDAAKAQALPLMDVTALRAIANLESEVVLVTGHDGVKVPMSVIYAKGFKKDGTAPALVSGYAGYGLVDEPFFSRGFVTLAERGFVVAVCHARGSGAYGERWHKAGYKATKPNTWKDMISCAEHLGEERLRVAEAHRGDRRQRGRHHHRPRRHRAPGRLRRGGDPRGRARPAALRDHGQRQGQHPGVRHRRDCRGIPGAEGDEHLPRHRGWREVSGAAPHARLQRSARAGVDDHQGLGALPRRERLRPSRVDACRDGLRPRRRLLDPPAPRRDRRRLRLPRGEPEIAWPPSLTRFLGRRAPTPGFPSTRPRPGAWRSRSPRS